MSKGYLQFTLVLTHACNLACGYCYMGAKSDRPMARETAARALEYAFARAGEIDLAFFGGEPLLAYDHLIAVADRAREMATDRGATLRMQVTTNGTLLTPARARELARREVRVTLSLDGDRIAHEATRPRESGGSSFDAAVRAARILRAEGLPLEVIAVLAPENAARLEAGVRFLAGLGATRIVLNPCYERPWSDEDLGALEAELGRVGALYADRMRRGAPLAINVFDDKLVAALSGPAIARRTCGGGRESLAVAPSGNLYACERMVAEDTGGRFFLGTLDDGIAVGAVESIARGPADPACAPCAERWRCSSGCACANLAETGEPDRPGGTQCWIEQTTARIADEIGRALLEEGCPAFTAWAYGGLAMTTRVKRPRRLAVMGRVS